MATPHLDPLLLTAPFNRRTDAVAPSPGPTAPDPSDGPRRAPTRFSWGGTAFVAGSAGGFLLIAGCVAYGLARLFA